MYTPFLVCPFQPRIVFDYFFFHKGVSEKLKNLLIHLWTFQLCIFDVIYIWCYFIYLFMKIWIWSFNIFWNFNNWWPIFTISWFTHLFLRLTSEWSDAFDKLKKPSPLEYAYLLIYQWTITWKKISLINIYYNIIYRFVLNNCILFIIENLKKI